MTPIHTFHGNTITSRSDQLAIEEPLEIRITYGPLTNRSRHTLAVTMRTPGHDDDLAIGYLISEGLLTDPDDIVAVTSLDVNAIRIDLKPHVHVDLARLTRTGFVSSSCGVCGRTVVDTLETVCEPIRDSARVSAAVIHDLPRRLRAAQSLFDTTGGLHAVGLFDLAGNLLTIREDIGRHNAADKLFGAEFRARRWPLSERIVHVSARASFELVQKAAIAGAPIFAAVGAPSTLAVETAKRLGITLLGFVRDERFNVYCGLERLA